MAEHTHRYRLTPLREDEMPRDKRTGLAVNPQYGKGTYVFCCVECGHLYFGNVWVDRYNPKRTDMGWVGDNAK